MDRITKSIIYSVLVATLMFTFLLRDAAAQERFRCAVSPIAAVDKDYGPPHGWNYDRDRVANAYGLFAAASYDTYITTSDKEARSFAIADNDPRLGRSAQGSTKTGWRVATDFSNGRVSNPNGLSFDVYTKDSGADLHVLVAYRGTDGWINVDLISNLSWFTQWFNPNDQYRDARIEFKKVVDYAVLKAKGRSIAFVVTGHSLGGGLARHIAHVYECVSAVVFNPSFVTNEHFFGKYTPKVLIRVYEDNDGFSIISRLQPRGDNNNVNALYRMNGAERGSSQHSMEALAAALLRTAIECTTRDVCDLKHHQVREAVVLYCERYLGRRGKEKNEVCLKYAAKN